MDRALGPQPVPWLLRPIAAVALLAFLMGRALAPALRGTSEGLDAIIPAVDAAGSFATYLFAFVGLAATLHAVRRTRHYAKLGVVYRRASVVCAAAIVLVLGPAFYRPLPPAASIVLALASAVLALLAAWETVRVPLTRALGVLLLTAGVAAGLHVIASVLAWQAGERARYGLAVFARFLATGSVLFDAMTLLTAFAWLSTRPQKEAVWLARAAMFGGCMLAWVVTRARDGGGFWPVLAERVLTRELASPPPYVWEWLRYALEATAPLLAMAAILIRRQVPSITGAIALLLIARPVTDVPLSAVSLALAGLFGALAARDERGTWAALLRHDARPSASPVMPAHGPPPSRP